MAKTWGNKYWCDMYFTQSDECFWNKYEFITNILTLHDPGVMLLPSASGHLSVYYDGIISSDLDCSFLQGRTCHLGLSLWGVSSSFEVQGEVNLPHAASSIDPPFTGLRGKNEKISEWVRNYF